MVRSALRDPITVMTGRVEVLDFKDIVELVPLRLFMSRQGYLERRIVGTGLGVCFHLEATIVNFDFLLVFIDFDKVLMLWGSWLFTTGFPRVASAHRIAAVRFYSTPCGEMRNVLQNVFRSLYSCTDPASLF